MSRELLKRAAVVLREVWDNDDCYCAPSVIELQKQIVAYLAKPDPEPVAFRWFGDEGFTFSLFQSEESPGDPLYTTPPDQSAQIAELIAQRTMQEEIIKSAYARCGELEQQLADLQANREPDPIAYITGWYGGYPTISIIDGAVLPNGTPLYAAPPERKPLSNEEIELLRVKTLLESEGPLRLGFIKEFARAIETAHGITS